jgi:hypothetical protein
MLFRSSFIAILASFLSISAFSFSEWDGTNSPENFQSNFITKFRMLPTSGELRKKPWTASYWPTYQGGISHRWLTGEVKYSRIGYSPKGIDYLSPSEKFDIYIGRTDFPLTSYERKRTNILYNNNIPKWEGLCHAWSPASYLFDEPNPITVTGKNGEKIQFGSADIKALLMINFDLSKGSEKTKFLGSRCSLDQDSRNFNYDSSCSDTNAGAFHVVLTNYIGIRKESFVIDRTRDAEVWNQPVEAYSIKVLKEYRGATDGAAPGTSKEVVVEANVRWVGEVENQWNRSGTNLKVSTYRYRLELDSRGRIIGGAWLSWERPDFIWTQTRPNFSGFMGPLKDLYERSVR